MQWHGMVYMSTLFSLFIPKKYIIGWIIMKKIMIIVVFLFKGTVKKIAIFETTYQFD